MIGFNHITIDMVQPVAHRQDTRDHELRKLLSLVLVTSLRTTESVIHFNENC